MKALLDVLSVSAGTTLVLFENMLIPAMVSEIQVESLKGSPTSPPRRRFGRRT